MENGRLIRDRFGWGDAPVVAFVGQQVPHKGIDMVLEAMGQNFTWNIVADKHRAAYVNSLQNRHHE